MSEIVTSQQKIQIFGDMLNDYVVWQVQREQVRQRNYLPRIIEKNCDTRHANRQAVQTTLPQLVTCWKALREEQNKKNEGSGHLFNALALIPIGEITHSRLLGNLLDPKGSHGQGGLLLHAFLKSIDVPEPSTGRWMITIEEARVDLCLCRRSPASVIIIENKSNGAVDQSNQLYHYWHENIHKPYPALDYSSDEVKKSFQIIYLPPTAEKQPAFQSLQRPAYLAALKLPKDLDNVGITIKICSFRDHITAWLSQCDDLVPKGNYRLRAHLQFYKEIWT